MLCKICENNTKLLVQLRLCELIIIALKRNLTIKNTLRVIFHTDCTRLHQLTLWETTDKTWFSWEILMSTVNIIGNRATSLKLICLLYYSL